MKKGAMVFMFILMFSGIAAADQTFNADDFQGIPNAVELAPDVVSGGAPTQEGLALLKAKGFKTVIDMRRPEEGTAREELQVRLLGLNYVNIPMASRSPSEDQVAALREELENEDTYPVLMHCASGARSGALWKAYQASQSPGV